ncbi:MAG: hypothetical protein LC799_28890, partial [Actinobacteria bacterium]|nr:hypothetical protein [Actinomycetota bacterium]
AMTPVTLDIVLVMPESLRMQAIACSEFLSAQLVAGGSSSHFQLGKPFPGEHGEHCEPHVSLFMLTVDEVEVDEVTYVVEQLAKTLPALAVEGAEYRHNLHGAPEVYFTKSAAWGVLQRAIVTSVEPLRRGRLREVDPSGVHICDLVDSSQHNSRRQQLLRYGYDEVADESNGGHDRFNPHMTLSWPRDPNFRFALEGLSSPRAFSGLLTELAVFSMSAYGTCTRNHGTFRLSVHDGGSTRCS